MMNFIGSFEYRVALPVKTRGSMATGSELFAFLVCGFVEIFEQIVSTRLMTLINTNVVASRLIKKGKAGCCSLLKNAAQLNVATKASRIPPNLHFPGEREFFLLMFCLGYLSKRSKKVDCHFANYRFSFRFVPFRFSNYSYSKPKLIQTLETRSKKHTCSTSNPLSMQLKVSCCCLVISRAQT